MSVTLFVTNDFGPRAGGIETFVHGLIERFPRNSIVVYTSQQGDTSSYDATWLKNYGVTVYRDRSKMLLPTPRVIREVRKVIEKERPEAVVFGAAAPLALMGKFLPVKRKIALTHGHEVWWAKVFPFNLLMRLIGNSVDHLTYLGEYTKSEICKGISAKARAAMVQIAPGIDIEKFKPVDASELRSSLGLTNKEVIVSVGRLVPRKGQDKLIEALPLVKKEIPNIKLVFVGEGSIRKNLEKKAKQLGLQENVIFVGRVPYKDLPNHFLLGDIFAMPSRSRLFGLEVEGLGIVYLEASACGLPVLVGDSGGAPDAVQDGITGSVVNGNRTRKIAREIVKILNGKPTAMGGMGREWALSYWTWHNWANRFQKLID